MSIAKLLILLAFGAIVGSLASGLVFLLKDNADSRRTVRALTWRIGLSIGLFILLLLAYAAGLIRPGQM